MSSGLNSLNIDGLVFSMPLCTWDASAVRDTWGLPARRGRGHTAVRREMRTNLPNTIQKEPVGHPLRGSGGHAVVSGPAAPAVQEHPLGPPHRGGMPPRPWCIPICNTEALKARIREYTDRNFCGNSSTGYASHAPPPKEEASWLLGFARPRGHPLTWKVCGH